MTKLALIAGAGLLVLGSVGAADAQIAQYDNWIDRPNGSDQIVRGGVLTHPVPVITNRATPPRSREQKGFVVSNEPGDVVSTGSV